MRLLYSVLICPKIPRMHYIIGQREYVRYCIFTKYKGMMQLCKPHISPDWQDYWKDYSESEEDDEHAESEDEGSESEMQDEGDEDWTSNNGKSGESDDEDALKSVEHLKKSVDDLKRLVPIYHISLSCCIRNVFRCFSQKRQIFGCVSEKFTCFIYRKNLSKTSGHLRK